ncbi:isoaspartyl peptidase/L-asparaginase [bacterium]|nr:isoaspartyl peptidase/L-asparaginase [bacterium]
MKPKLIAHGGAWSIPEKFEKAHLRGLRRAVSEIYPQLLTSISALDAVEAAVKILEKDPTFDAGKGSFLNLNGEIELDAMIMDGSTLNFGSVVAVPNILHPVALSRLIMENTEHCLLAGTGALHFGKQMGMEEVDPHELLTSRELKFYEKIKNDPDFKTKSPFEPHPKGTVGAVAMDQNGNLAAATSTGGTPRKLPGRVGDSPIIGAGAYADNETGACSATGWGESIMRVLLCKTSSDLLKEYPAETAAKMSVQILEKRVNGWGGIILIDKQGHYGFAHNTSKMAFAYADEEGKAIARIKI